ncbi:MerR family transcriptional regulator [Lacrimispora saccharolytica]|uniref:Transcriptional regulator, MerR family n=1 Tax=Lacrimispora saccharolytica (strain ATCC 35040 / DSM 2544 / NRCC 2533 / WM1) TaxID=610130 RepID=D9R5M6_LACSW|nr:MerR family transcriptional regulator [Lacrimispora saccharolytica]ADL05209.1 transcriptional regulator, MerR family [[Clostridium] saccharolyticum WM1]QRV20613.1 MerR family transcriptional regulator [Lacrimispora saccharolytica]
MEYTINKLAKLAGISTRTLRYYDELGLLSPARVSSNGYRIYGQKEIDRLQQILFYRELGVSLEEIRNILASKDFDGLTALESHLSALLARREQLDLLVANVRKTIKTMKGEIKMSDQEKFEGFLQKLVDDNEQQYGEEIREKYGEESVSRSNAKVLNMSKEQYMELEKLTADLNETLKAAYEQGDPAGELARRACELHKRWLCFYWSDYSKEAHRGITQMYVEDPRFRAYYDKIAPGCAVFLRDAVAIFCK